MVAWQSDLQALPEVRPSHIELKDRVEIGRAEDLGSVSRDEFIEQRKAFHPWRKGPYSLCGVDIDTEWRSDWKWNRLKTQLDLKGHQVLDIGCGNGYFGLRMLGAGAKLVM